MSKKGTPVLVTTAARGVFFGYLVGEARPDRVVLDDCRMIVRWVNTRGLISLARSGPNETCRVSEASPRTEIIGDTAGQITSVSTCTPEAVERFEAAPWG